MCVRTYTELTLFYERKVNNISVNIFHKNNYLSYTRFTSHRFNI